MLSNGFDLNEFHPISMMRYMQSQYSEDDKNSSKTKQKQFDDDFGFFIWRCSTPFENEQSLCTQKFKDQEVGTYLKLIQMNIK